MKRTSIGNRGRNRAFTLVELLVVVSIIALLIAILMPSLRKARESAKRVACNSTIRGIALAGLTYAADDPQEHSIPANATAHRKSSSYFTLFGYGGKSGVGTLQPNPWDSSWGAKNGMGAFTRPLNKTIYKSSFKNITQWAGNDDFKADAELDLAAYKCAGDKQFPGMHIQGWRDNTHAKSAYDYFGTSYACNPMWIVDPVVPAGQRKLESNGMYLRPVSRVPNPGNTIMFWEASARYAMYSDNPDEYGPKGSSAPGQPPEDCRDYYDDSFVAKGFHSDPWHFNVAFGDGHAAWVKIRSYGIATGNQVPPRCGENGSRCICVLVRGRGWQLDTMPAPFVTSEFSASSGGKIVDSQQDSGERTVVK